MHEFLMRLNNLRTIIRPFIGVSLLIALSAIFFSCVPAGTVRHVSPTEAEKYGSKAALIINKKFKDAVTEITVKGKCVERGKVLIFCTECYVKDGSMHATYEVGLRSEKLFTEELSLLFPKIDTYTDIKEVKAGYDYILIPESKVVASYDKEIAKNRNIDISHNRTLLIGGKPVQKFSADAIPIDASVEYSLQVVDAKDGKVIDTITGKGSAKSKTETLYCGNSRGLAKDYEEVISKADTDAFRELTNSARVVFLPPDLHMSANFSDKDSLFPNNMLDSDEEAELAITLTNKGKGKGYSTRLHITSEPKLSFFKDIEIGNIPPGETRNIKIPIKNNKIVDGLISFRLELKEKRGHDVKEVVLSVRTSNELYKVIEDITTTVKSLIKQKGKKGVIVAGFKPQNDGFNKLRKYVSDRLSTELSQTEGLYVVESSLLIRPLTELGIDMLDLINLVYDRSFLVKPETMKKLSKLTGADTILVITVSELKGKIKIDSSLVDTETTKIYAVATKELVMGN